ncbi:fla cluster protein FlaF [Halobellus sp. Atlit-31R]|nr:fla cluster protein FlaF [Halobellus sp. Atlit-31R]
MGFGVSGSTAVIFLGVLIASGTLYTAAAGSAEQIAEAHDDDSERLLDRRNTALDVTRVIYNSSSGNLEVDVKNTGTTALSVNGTTLLLDNEYEEPISTEVGTDDATDVWGADQTLALFANVGQEPDHVKIVAENGVAASNTTVEVVN